MSPAPTVSRNNPENIQKNGIRTMVEHFNGEKTHAGERYFYHPVFKQPKSDDQTTQSILGTKTVTRTITPTGELSVYASQSSVRFKMTSKGSKQENGSQLYAVPKKKNDFESEDGCRDLYPITTLKKSTPSHRSMSMREQSDSNSNKISDRSSRSFLPSPNFNIVQRDTEHVIEVEMRKCQRNFLGKRRHKNIFGKESILKGWDQQAKLLCQISR